MFRVFFINFDDPLSNYGAINGAFNMFKSQKQTNKKFKRSFINFSKSLGSFSLTKMTVEGISRQ